MMYRTDLSNYRHQSTLLKIICNVHQQERVMCTATVIAVTMNRHVNLRLLIEARVLSDVNN